MMMAAVNEPCRECGGVVTVRGYTSVQKVGKWTVTDRSSVVPQCTTCNAPQLSLDDIQGYELRAVNTVLCEGHFEGDVIRYARKALGLTQKELGKILDYTHETVSRWENGKEPVPRSGASALIGLILRVTVYGEDPRDIVASIEAPMPIQATNDLEVHSPSIRRVG